MTHLDDDHLADRLRRTFAQAADVAPRTLQQRTGTPATPRPRRSTARVLIAALVAAVIIPATFLTVRATQDQPASGESPMATYPRTSGPLPNMSLQAGMDGVLQVVDGCLVITGGGDGATTLDYFVVFPTPDTSWHSDHIEYRGASFRIGERIILGGGHTGPGLPPDAVVPSSCANLGKGFLGDPFVVGDVDAPTG